MQRKTMLAMLGATALTPLIPSIALAEYKSTNIPYYYPVYIENTFVGKIMVNTLNHKRIQGEAFDSGYIQCQYFDIYINEFVAKQGEFESRNTKSKFPGYIIREPGKNKSFLIKNCTFEISTCGQEMLSGGTRIRFQRPKILV